MNEEAKQGLKTLIPFGSVFLIISFVYLVTVGFFSDKSTWVAWAIGTPVYFIASAVLVWQFRRHMRGQK